MKYKDWLNGLKVGDEVIVDTGLLKNEFKLLKIGRSTPTKVWVEGRAYYKSDGSKTSSSFRSIDRLYMSTQNPDKRIAILNKIGEIKRAEIFGLNDEAIDRLHEIVTDSKYKGDQINDQSS